VNDAMRLVRDALPLHLNADAWAVDVLAMTTNFAVFYAYGTPELKGFHQIQYSVTNEGAVTFTGDPEPVNLMTKIMPRQTVSANSGSTNSNEDSAMTGTTGTGGAPATEAPAGTGTPEVVPTPAAPATPVVASAPTPPTLDVFLETAPAEIRGVLQEAIGIRTQRKTSLIEAIKANSRNTFTDEQLTAFELPQLEGLAALADIPSFAGQGGSESNSLNVNGAQPVSTFAVADTSYLLDSPAGNA
jgi:hypothetical protein